MEGLIKGLADVILGANDQDRDQHHQSHDDEERSRSSWAEVVSGDQDQDQQVPFYL